MTNFKSASSNRLVVSGWLNVVPGKADTVEVQFDLNERDFHREQACLLIDYWATPEDVTLQSLLPMRAFAQAAREGTGWCVFVPAQGRLMVRAVDIETSPPIMASQWVDIDPSLPSGTQITVGVHFPTPEETEIAHQLEKAPLQLS